MSPEAVEAAVQGDGADAVLEEEEEEEECGPVPVHGEPPAWAEVRLLASSYCLCSSANFSTDPS